jgi:hypothetical protein
MKNDRFEREKDFGAAAAITKTLLERGIVNGSDHDELIARFAREYRPLICTLRTPLESGPAVKRRAEVKDNRRKEVSM